MQERASANNIIAKANFELGNQKQAVASATQAVKLARQEGDKSTQASAEFTLASAEHALGHYQNAKRAAEGAHTKFAELGLKKNANEAEQLADRISENLPRKRAAKYELEFMPPVDSFRAMKGALWQDAAQTVIWSKGFNEGAYVGYCLELLNFVNDIVKNASRSSVLVATRGVHNREIGEQLVGQPKGVTGSAVWAVVRQVKMELPRLHIACVDMPEQCTGSEVAHFIECAMRDPGDKQEVVFALDRPMAARLKAEREG